MRLVTAGTSSSGSGWCVGRVAGCWDPSHDLECMSEVSELLASLVFDVQTGFFVGVSWNNTCVAFIMSMYRTILANDITGSFSTSCINKYSM